MDQLGHTDPSFTLRVYRHGMRRDEASKRSLRELVGFYWAAMGSSGQFGDSAAAADPLGGNEKAPISRAFDDGRAWVRTRELSRVKPTPAAAGCCRVLRIPVFIGVWWLGGSQPAVRAATLLPPLASTLLPRGSSDRCIYDVTHDASAGSSGDIARKPLVAAVPTRIGTADCRF